jgi:RING finger protein 113A
VDEDHEKDQRAQNERNADIQKKLAAGELESGIYRGKNAYKSYFDASEGKISSSKVRRTYLKVIFERNSNI